MNRYVLSLACIVLVSACSKPVEVPEQGIEVLPDVPEISDQNVWALPDRIPSYKVVHTNSQDAENIKIFEYQNSDAMQLSQSIVVGELSLQTKTLFIDGRTYEHDGDIWTEIEDSYFSSVTSDYPVSLTYPITENIGEGALDPAMSISQLQESYQGPLQLPCGDKTCLSYFFEYAPESDVVYIQTYYVDPDDGRIVTSVLTTNDGANIHTVTKNYEYDADISLLQPEL